MKKYIMLVLCMLVISVGSALADPLWTYHLSNNAGATPIGTRTMSCYGGGFGTSCPYGGDVLEENSGIVLQDTNGNLGYTVNAYVAGVDPYGTAQTATENGSRGYIGNSLSNVLNPNGTVLQTYGHAYPRALTDPPNETAIYGCNLTANPISSDPCFVGNFEGYGRIWPSKQIFPVTSSNTSPTNDDIGFVSCPNKVCQVLEYNYALGGGVAPSPEIGNTDDANEVAYGTPVEYSSYKAAEFSYDGTHALTIKAADYQLGGSVIQTGFTGAVLLRQWGYWDTNNWRFSPASAFNMNWGMNIGLPGIDNNPGGDIFSTFEIGEDIYDYNSIYQTDLTLANFPFAGGDVHNYNYQIYTPNDLGSAVFVPDMGGCRNVWIGTIDHGIQNQPTQATFSNAYDDLTKVNNIMASNYHVMTNVAPCTIPLQPVQALAPSQTMRTRVDLSDIPQLESEVHLGEGAYINNTGWGKDGPIIGIAVAGHPVQPTPDEVQSVTHAVQARMMRANMPLLPVHVEPALILTGP